MKVWAIFWLAAGLATGAAETNVPPLQHRFLAVDESRSQLLLVDTAHPAQNWAIQFPERYRDLQLVGNQRALLNTSQGFREYDLRTRKLVHEVKEARFAGCMTARRLPDGRTILGGNRKSGVFFYELGADDKVLRTMEFPTLNTLRTVRQTQSGTLIFGAGDEKIVEVDWAGKLLRSVTVPGAKHTYQVLEKPDGHWLAATGYGCAIVELDRAGNAVRRWGGAPAPAGLGLHFFAGFQVLKNGNLVICNWTGHGADDSTQAPQLLEYAPDGRLVGQWHNAKLAGSLHGIIVLDDLDLNALNDDTSGVLDAVCTLDRATGTTIDPEPFLRNAWGSRWNTASNRIAYMQPNAKGYYRIFTVSPAGGKPLAITEGQPGLLPDRHQGMLDWHPSGRYLLFASEKPEWSSLTLFGAPDYEALPGFGRHDDLWLITADGRHSWQLINEPNTKDEGILVPVFAPDGRHIAWSSRQPGHMKYVLKVADFVETPEPHIENIRSYEPGGKTYYETGSFTSDSQQLTYTSDQDTHSFFHSQIYILDLTSGKSMRLTAGNDYNEHPIVVHTPGGDWIVYMSTKGVDRFPFQFKLALGTDWYAMRTDGSAAKRLTTMNVNRKDNPENAGRMQIGCTVAISPSGDFMLGDVQDDVGKQTGSIRVVHFTGPETPSSMSSTVETQR